MICVVEGVGDLWALERASVFHGLYHVLGGTLSALSGMGPEDLNVASLLARVGQDDVIEVILALGARWTVPLRRIGLPIASNHWM